MSLSGSSSQRPLVPLGNLGAGPNQSPAASSRPRAAPVPGLQKFLDMQQKYYTYCDTLQENCPDQEPMALEQFAAFESLSEILRPPLGAIQPNLELEAQLQTIRNELEAVCLIITIAYGSVTQKIGRNRNNR